MNMNCNLKKIFLLIMLLFFDQATTVFSMERKPYGAVSFSLDFEEESQEGDLDRDSLQAPSLDEKQPSKQPYDYEKKRQPAHDEVDAKYEDIYEKNEQSLARLKRTRRQYRQPCSDERLAELASFIKIDSSFLGEKYEITIFNINNNTQYPEELIRLISSPLRYHNRINEPLEAHEQLKNNSLWNALKVDGESLIKTSPGHIQLDINDTFTDRLELTERLARQTVMPSIEDPQRQSINALLHFLRNDQGRIDNWHLFDLRVDEYLKNFSAHQTITHSNDQGRENQQEFLMLAEIDVNSQKIIGVFEYVFDRRNVCYHRWFSPLDLRKMECISNDILNKMLVCLTEEISNMERAKKRLSGFNLRQTQSNIDLYADKTRELSAELAIPNRQANLDRLPAMRRPSAATASAAPGRRD